MVDMRLDLRLEQTKGQWNYTAYLKGVLAATLEITPHADKVLIHNKVYLWSKTLLMEYRKCYARIRSELKAYGMVLIITCSDRYTAKMGKYWRMMGFKVFGECDTATGQVPFAVMEV